MMKKLYASTDPAISDMEQAHLELVRARAGECMVLLQNNGVLPLSGAGKVALYGNGARDTVRGGTGSGDVNTRFSVSIEQGLAEAGFTVTTGDWLTAQHETAAAERQAYLAGLEKEAAAAGVDVMLLTLGRHYIPTHLAPLTHAQMEASGTDTAIYVLARSSGEGTDRCDVPGDYRLLPAELDMLQKLCAFYKKVILLLNVGGVVELAPALEISGLGAVLLVGQAGNVGGRAVADVLLGRAVPSGRLTDTWAVHYADYPSSAEFSHNNGDCSDEYYKDGIYVGYRYFDTFHVEPLYPFGYGLNYTSFSMETTAVEVHGAQVSAAVRVVNTGDRFAGRHVVQIYASAPRTELEKPFQVLVGFGKTRLLQPGESQTLTITFPLTNLESYSPAQAAYALEAGNYVLRVGENSRSTAIAAQLCLDRTVLTKKVKNICPLDVPFKEISSRGTEPRRGKNEAQQLAAAPLLPVRGDEIPAQTVTYHGIPAPLPVCRDKHTITMEDVRAGRYTMEQLVSQLTVAEMADLCVGDAREGDSVIGSASKHVPGAAGDTSLLLAGRGVRDMTNADGPAGLRLMPHFRTDAEGNVLPGGEVFGDLSHPLSEKQPGQIDYYQYCTAIPIATLLASSWDLALIESMGDLIGAEMERFGVRIHLAPGMNIHRNPLCGRNFEYYSEDPLLSGLCAAADVRGVQGHAGTGTSIKHFCANNQEDNRMGVNAHIHERALREIYLRNFGVAIQAAQPMTLMTSYNLINGIHTANSYDAITCYSREENGFAGYVMTDWYSSNAAVSALFSMPGGKYPCSGSPECVYAGNDVQMPGSGQNIADITAAVEHGTLPLGMLQRCCVRILNTDLACASFEDAGPYAAHLPLKSFVDVQ